MSSIRTQIYLTEEQRARIDQLATAEGLTMADVVRRALDRYLDSVAPDPTPALAATFGADPGAEAPSRDEWSQRNRVDPDRSGSTSV